MIGVVKATCKGWGVLGASLGMQDGVLGHVGSSFKVGNVLLSARGWSEFKLKLWKAVLKETVRRGDDRSVGGLLNFAAGVMGFTPDESDS